ncbi:MAG: stage II sporulation protein M [Alphaproteobacteria bacterium]|jgi:uncharacterized membrane protein SpoIIM required for sporulation
MASGDLIKSYRFRAEREQNWRDLEGLIDRAEKRGLRSLSPEEILRIPTLYRACMSSLSVARSISLDANLLDYLEGLATRAYFTVYGVRTGLGGMLRKFFAVDFPAAVRKTRVHGLASAFLLFLGIAAGWSITATNPDWYYAFISADMAGGRTPEATRAELEATIFETVSWRDALITFAAFLFSNNAGVAMLCFALGAIFGIPVVLLLLFNGLTLGAMCAVFAGQGLAVGFLGWLSIHGTTELLAIILCGGAGFYLGGGMISPGRQSRLAALADRGRTAAVVVMGAVAMLFVAAILEGLGRQLIQETWLRFAIGGIMLAFWLTYFARGGIDHGDD